MSRPGRDLDEARRADAARRWPGHAGAMHRRAHMFLIPLLTLPTIKPIPGLAEPVSSLTHLVGAGVFAALSVPMLRRAWGHWGRVAALGCFVVSVVFMFSMSGVYHLLTPETTGRAVLQRLDHAGIFFLIAGSFTAAHGILFRGWLRWGIIGLIWAMVATAIPLKMVFFEDMSQWLGLALYLGMGWIGLLSGWVVLHRYGVRFMAPLLGGGVAYTVGAVLEFIGRPNPIPGVVHAHELFHLFVIGGVACHWAFAMRFADGRLPAPAMSLGDALDEVGIGHHDGAEP